MSLEINPSLVGHPAARLVAFARLVLGWFGPTRSKHDAHMAASELSQATEVNERVSGGHDPKGVQRELLAVFARNCLRSTRVGPHTDLVKSFPINVVAVFRLNCLRSTRLGPHTDFVKSRNKNKVQIMNR